MAFNMPDKEILNALGNAGLTDVRNLAEAEIISIRASTTRETITDEQAQTLTSLVAGIEFIDAKLDEAEAKAATYDTPIPSRKVKEVAPVEAATTVPFNDQGEKSVEQTVTAPVVDGQVSEVVSATVTAAGVTKQVGITDVAPYQPLPEDNEGRSNDEKFSIVAAAPLTLGRKGRIGHQDTVNWDTVGKAFD
jgi:hypothetical protein